MIVADSLTGLLAAVVAGSLLAVGVAVALSPIGPIGPVRPVYPSPASRRTGPYSGPASLSWPASSPRSPSCSAAGPCGAPVP